MLIAQISDCHIVAAGGTVAERVDPAAGLRSAVVALNEMTPRPDVVVASGDLVDSGSAVEYDRLMTLLSDLAVPVLPIPGNHDDRGELRRRFGVVPPGGSGDPIDYVVDGHDVRLIVLDTTIPGSNAGRLTADQMAWLDARLGEAARRPTVVAQHHPPFTTGIPWMDRDCGFTGGNLQAEVLARHDHVEAVLCGHLHRAMHRRFGGTVVSVAPSTCVQLALVLDDRPATYAAEPTGFALHQWSAPGGLVSHVVPIGEHETWVPGWAVEPALG